jgi:hypothetical protein
MGDAKKGENNFLYGKKRPEHSMWLKKNHPMKGKHHTPKSRLNMRFAKLGCHLSSSHKKQISVSNSGKNNYWFGKNLTANHKRKMVLSRFGFSSYKEYRDSIPKKKRYRQDVLIETHTSLRENPRLKNFSKRGRSGVDGAYQLDHIISIDDGFRKHIEPKRIGAYKNLRMIPWRENASKNRSSLWQ